MSRFLFSLFLIITLSGCSPDKTRVDKTETIEISIRDFGRCKLLNKAFFEITKLKKQQVTSAFYYTENDTVKFIPINDGTFNYDYFYKKIYPLKEGTKVTLEVKKYLINKVIVLVAFKIK